MSSSDDVCWRLAGECGRWADEAQDRATREAFRQMAKVWAQLAFGYHYKPPSEKADEIAEGCATFVASTLGSVNQLRGPSGV